MPRPQATEPQTLMTIRIPVRLKKRLEELAKKDQRPTTAYARMVLEDHAKRKRK